MEPLLAWFGSTILERSFAPVRMSRAEASGTHPAHLEFHPNKRQQVAASSHIARKKQHERGQQRLRRAVRKVSDFEPGTLRHSVRPQSLVCMLVIWGILGSTPLNLAAPKEAGGGPSTPHLSGKGESPAGSFPGGGGQSSASKSERRPPASLDDEENRRGQGEAKDCWGSPQMPRTCQYPEDAEEHLNFEHRQISVPMERAECSCPEVLSRGTLGAIVAALAFLGFFSTSVLLVVAVCVLRLVEKQRKTGKEAKALYPPSRRLPPIPPPRPEHTFMKPHGYEHLRPPAPQLPTEGEYMNASELNPGPRNTQKLHYSKMKPVASHTKSNLEKDYVTPRRLQPYSTPPLVRKYANAEESQPAAIMQDSPDFGMSPLGRDSHIYEEVE